MCEPGPPLPGAHMLLPLDFHAFTMAFPVDIASTGALASGHYLDIEAPPIAVGDAFGNALDHANLEFDMRKRLHDDVPNSVTCGELRRSRRRLVAVETTVARVCYGNGIAGLGAQMAAKFADLRDLIASLDRQSTAQCANLPRRHLNRSMTWTPILVERAGVNPVGVPPAIYPASRDAVLVMTGVQIDALQAAFNLPAGHFDGPNINKRRLAVLSYVDVG